jgi:hypothetical protein
LKQFRVGRIPKKKEVFPMPTSMGKKNTWRREKMRGIPTKMNLR